MPANLAATRSPSADEWAISLDLDATVEVLRSTGKRPWPGHMAREIAIEFRRLLILRQANPGEPVAIGPLLQEFCEAFRAASEDRQAIALTEDLDTAEIEATQRRYEQRFGRPLPETWFSEDVDKFLGSSQPGIVG